MCTYETDRVVPGDPAAVLDLLTDPAQIPCWAPVPFELLELKGHRLVSGSRARVRGRLAGHRVEFDVNVTESDDQRFALVASGPVSMSVHYLLGPDVGGTLVRAAVSVDGDGVLGTMIAEASCAMLRAGTLDAALDNLAQGLDAASVRDHAASRTTFT